MSHCANSVKHYKTLQFRYVFISIFFLYLLNKLLFLSCYNTSSKKRHIETIAFGIKVWKKVV